MKVIAINGISSAGKDSFALRVREICGGRVTIYSTIDPVKDLYRQMGWDGVKTDEDRKSLNILKAIWNDLNLGPVRWVQERIERDADSGVYMSFVMVREYEEMMKFAYWGRQVFGCGYTLEVVRDGLPVPPVEQEFLRSHPSGYQYNWTVYNKTTDDPELTELRDTASDFLWRLENGNIEAHNRVGFEFDLSEYKAYVSGE